MPCLLDRAPHLVHQDAGQCLDAVHLQGRAGVELRRHLGVRRVDHCQGGPGGQDLEGRTDDVGLPDRLRVLTGVGAVLNRAKVRAGETAAVFGVGGVGLNVIQGCAWPARAGSSPSTRWPRRRGWPGSSAPPTSWTPRRPTPWPPSGRSSRPARQGDRRPRLDGWGQLVVRLRRPPRRPAQRTRRARLGGNALAIGIPPQGTEVSVDVNALAYVDRGLLGCRYGSSRPHHDIPLMVGSTCRASSCWTSW